MRKVIAALVFMGALWQLEIADLCIYNNWIFGYLFCWIQTSNLWGVRDFWMLLMIIAFITAAYEPKKRKH